MLRQMCRPMTCCASCGIAEVDDITLKPCDVSDLVRYCSDKCQQDHRIQQRAAELRDEILFRQPESSYLGDCPICFIPLPIQKEKSIIKGCCSKVICISCNVAEFMCLQRTCPFCRQPVHKDEEEANMILMRRVEANDPIAMCEEGKHCYREGDYEGAFKYWTKAAELGDADAHCQLAFFLYGEDGVEQDEKKELYHLEEASIAGHPEARCQLAFLELENGRNDRAVKHWIIAANLGCGTSIQRMKFCYKHGVVSKEDFAAALRAHQAAVDATKTPQREALEESRKMLAAKGYI